MLVIAIAVGALLVLGGYRMSKHRHGHGKPEDEVSGTIHAHVSSELLMLELPWRAKEADAEFTDEPGCRPACEISKDDKIDVDIVESHDGTHQRNYIKLRFTVSTPRVIRWHARKF